MPCFIESASASVYFTALEDSVPSLGMAGLMKLSQKVPFVVTILGADGAGSNIRCKSHMAALVDEHNRSRRAGAVLIWDVFCAVHAMRRIAISTFGYTQPIPRMYDLCFLSRFPPRMNRLVRAVHSIVET